MYRQDPVTRRWVIFAPHRANRPNSLVPTEKCEIDSKCPFCAGPDAPDRVVFQVNRSERGWEQYVLANKFPAVQSELEPERHREKCGKITIDGFGISEVIVETPKHCSDLESRPSREIKALFRIYKDRMTELFKDGRVTQVVVFKNNGKKAGASQPHPHSQVYGLPIVPGHIRFETDCCRRFYDDEGICPYCYLNSEETKEMQRVVIQDEKLVALCPYASENPYEVHVFPVQHVTSLTLISDFTLDALAEATQKILCALKTVLGQFDYNLIWDSAPKDDCDAPFFHLRLRIIPRLATPAGFEMASQMAVNPVLPEFAAESLRQALKKG